MRMGASMGRENGGGLEQGEYGGQRGSVGHGHKKCHWRAWVAPNESAGGGGEPGKRSKAKA
jgi:hypothetical protein